VAAGAAVAAGAQAANTAPALLNATSFNISRRVIFLIFFSPYSLLESLQAHPNKVLI
jgi:hypothetical protein